jgi:hypothetical protein
MGQESLTRFDQPKEKKRKRNKNLKKVRLAQCLLKNNNFQK